MTREKVEVYCGSVACHGALPDTARDGTCWLKHLYYLLHTYLTQISTSFSAQSSLSPEVLPFFRVSS